MSEDDKLDLVTAILANGALASRSAPFDPKWTVDTFRKVKRELIATGGLREADPEPEKPTPDLSQLRLQTGGRPSGW